LDLPEIKYGRDATPPRTGRQSRAHRASGPVTAGRCSFSASRARSRIARRLLEPKPCSRKASLPNLRSHLAIE